MSKIIRIIVGAIIAICLLVFAIKTVFNVGGGRVYKITNCAQLQAMNDDLDGVYILMNDIDCLKESVNDLQNK